MKFTIGWLKEHLDTRFKDNEIIEKLTDVGLEVESFEKARSEFNNFKVAKIINTEKHPNADRLKVWDVDIGEQNIIKVVCGAPNAKKNLIGVFAKPGTYIPGIDLKLAVGEIRGEKSFGMMCSERELEISDEHDGIIELDKSAKIGSNFLTFTNTFIFFFFV